MRAVKSSLLKLNNKALKVVKQYQNIPFEGKTISTPYFINSVEQVYKNVFTQVGVPSDLIDRAIKLFREDKTPLGSRAGKATPKEIEAALLKLQKHLLIRDIDLSTKPISVIRNFMKEFHIGIDCSGLVFNVFLLATSKTEREVFKSSLLWRNPHNQIAMQASCSIFNSPKLTDVTNLKDLLPMDILLLKNTSHMGVILMQNNELFLVESTMGKDRVVMNRININSCEIENRREWSNSLKNGKVIIKRFKF